MTPSHPHLIDGPRSWCCNDMRRSSTNVCDIHDEHECPDVLITWFSDGSPGISIKNGGAVHSAINFCPWCGEPLR